MPKSKSDIDEIEAEIRQLTILIATAREEGDPDEHDEVVKKILALIETKVREGRIDEWKRLDFGVHIDKHFVKQHLKKLEGK